MLKSQSLSAFLLVFDGDFIESVIENRLKEIDKPFDTIRAEWKTRNAPSFVKTTKTTYIYILFLDPVA